MDRNEPEISVIVTAYLRKEYIMECVDSVLNQDLPKEKYEVLVVKNFVDSAIDGGLRTKGVTVIQSSRKELGDKIIEAFAQSRGKIIAFLEDDDWFAKEKLAWLHKTFHADTSLSYVHNSQIYVDEDGMKLQNFFSIPQKRSLYCGRDGMMHGTMRKIMGDKRIGHNMSSWAVIRSELDRVIHHFRGVIYTLDALILLEALKGEGSALFSSKQMTYYRRHASANSMSHDTIEVSKVSETLLDRTISEYSGLSNIFRNCKAYPFLKSTEEYLRLRRDVVQLHDIGSRNLVQFLHSSFKYATFRYWEYAVIFLILFLYKISKNMGRSLYLKVSYLTTG